MNMTLQELRTRIARNCLASIRTEAMLREQGYADNLDEFVSLYLNVISRVTRP